MRKINILIFTILFFFNWGMISCHHKTPPITYMDFLSYSDSVYFVYDTARENPIKSVHLYYLLGQANVNSVDLRQIEQFVSTDSLIQKQKNRSGKLSVMFYKTSQNTRNLVRIRTHKQLTLCNNDIIVEYLWEDGKQDNTYYYDEGKIKGSENIKLLD